jgi:hypothetical protein
MSVPTVFTQPGKTEVLRWDPYLEPNGDDMDFRLTYDGPLLAHKDGSVLPKRSLHVHDIRRKFHKQLKVLWSEHPILKELKDAPPEYHQPPRPAVMHVFEHDGFRWLPIVNEANGLICKIDVLLLRSGPPGEVVSDIDNRVKTILDALRKAKGSYELGAGTSRGPLTPASDEDPFYVLLEDDKLITHLSVTSDMLLEPVDAPRDHAVRLVISVTVRPYRPYIETLGYS